MRRSVDGSDDVSIRDQFHEIQEENDFYRSLLSIESVWLGVLYEKFINAIKKETMPKIQQAWDDAPLGPSARLQNIAHPNVQVYIKQFALDGRRFFNPAMRIIMRIKYILRKYIKDDGYGAN